MCVKLDYDIGSNSVLHPKDLREAHDREARGMKLKANTQLRRDFKMAMRAISGRLNFEMGGIKDAASGQRGEGHPGAWPPEQSAHARPYGFCNKKSGQRR